MDDLKVYCVTFSGGVCLVLRGSSLSAVLRSAEELSAAWPKPREVECVEVQLGARYRLAAYRVNGELVPVA